MNITRLRDSIRYAWKGMRYVYRHEQNFRFQTAIAVVVLAATFFFDLTTLETLIVLLLVTAVLSLELLNSAFETYIDVLRPRLHSQAEVVKDIMAAVVLCVSLGAVVVGLVIFIPHIVEFAGRL